MIVCYDTADADFDGGIPSDAPAIMFYVDGLYRNEAAARRRFPHLFTTGRAIGLTVRGRVPTEGEDFESGNWQGNVGQWVRACRAKGIWRPVVYANRSDMASHVIPDLEAIYGRPLPPPGPGRPFRLIVANPDGNPDIPTGYDGKQYWWQSIQGTNAPGNMDKSVLRDDFFHPKHAGGTFTADIAVNEHGHWTVHGTPSIHDPAELGGDPNLWWCAKIMVNRAHGQWKIHSLPAEHHKE